MAECCIPVNQGIIQAGKRLRSLKADTLPGSKFRVSCLGSYARAAGVRSYSSSDLAAIKKSLR